MRGRIIFRPHIAQFYIRPLPFPTSSNCSFYISLLYIVITYYKIKIFQIKEI